MQMKISIDFNGAMRIYPSEKLSQLYLNTHILTVHDFGSAVCLILDFKHRT